MLQSQRIITSECMICCEFAGVSCRIKYSNFNFKMNHRQNSNFVRNQFKIFLFYNIASLDKRIL